MKSLELLAPAGSPEALNAAVGAGADAVYLGLKNFNARMRSANFGYAQFEGALGALHRMKRKVYVTVNTVFEQREADRMYQLLKYLDRLGPDGLIVQDFGVIAMVREHFPGIKLHASTQMNIASVRGVNLLSKYGISRTVLARELSLPEIQDIRMGTNAELEIFVHGALCVSASGLCLFSSYLGGKSANRGLCTQACRRFYHQSAQQGYFFSPGDLQLLENLPALASAGVNACKIEGRMKSPDYVGTVVSAYRLVLDALGGTGESAAIEEAQKILLGDFARGKTSFYFFPCKKNEKPDWLKPEQSGGTGIPLGKILKVKGPDRGFLAFSSAGKELTLGDSVRLHRADDSERQSHKLTALEKDAEGTWISIPEGFSIGDEVYLIQSKAGFFPKKPFFHPVLPRNLDSYSHAPGHDSAPVFSLPVEKTEKKRKKFPPGMYVQISQVEDLYMIQSVRPERVLLDYTRKTAEHLLGDRPGPLPFSPQELILVLDPYFPQDMEPTFAEEIPALRELGYRCFVVNNLGHFSYFRSGEEDLIAGPYLYVFNRWANKFIADLGIRYFVSPLENNRQNLERTVEPNRRGFAFIPVFGYPALFRLRADLRGIYDFGGFSDSRGQRFFLENERDGSIVTPERPFSIVDKIPFLQEAGFERFIVALKRMKKKDYKEVMQAVAKAAPLPNISRFNWKDGFYRSD